MTTQTITAEVTGRGSDTTVPDDPDAVDADVYVGGELIGSVTLLPRAYDGLLAEWGSLENWADSSLIAALDAGVVTADEVVFAVIAQAGR
jgi:hypothetical protein